MECESRLEIKFDKGVVLVFGCELKPEHKGLHSSPGKTYDDLEYTLTWAADDAERKEKNQELSTIVGYAEATKG